MSGATSRRWRWSRRWSTPPATCRSWPPAASPTAAAWRRRWRWARPASGSARRFLASEEVAVPRRTTSAGCSMRRRGRRRLDRGPLPPRLAGRAAPDAEERHLAGVARRRPPGAAEPGPAKASGSPPGRRARSSATPGTRRSRARRATSMRWRCTRAGRRAGEGGDAGGADHRGDPRDAEAILRGCQGPVSRDFMATYARAGPVPAPSRGRPPGGRPPSAGRAGAFSPPRPALRRRDHSAPRRALQLAVPQVQHPVAAAGELGGVGDEHQRRPVPVAERRRAAR